MRRFHLQKVCYKNKLEKALKHIRNRKTFAADCVKKKRFFNNLNPSFVNDNKLFWKTIKPFFSNKENYG